MTAEDTSKPESKRLSPAEWEALKLLWEYGNHTLADLSEKFGIRKDSIHDRLKRDGVQKGARAHEVGSMVADAENEEIARQAAETSKRIHATKNDHYNWAEAIGKLVMQELLDAKKTNKPVGLKNDNLSALNKAAKTLETIRKERYTILGLDTELGDPDDVDEMIVTELTEEQVTAMQRQMRGIGEMVSDLDMEELTDFDDDGIVIEGE
ncbi:MAG: MarR family transcriptional regulator [Rhodobacterales bacterium]|nr:MarR family transcriptional regulator [Rhodobacterales bacterium]